VIFDFLRNADAHESLACRLEWRRITPFAAGNKAILLRQSLAAYETGGLRMKMAAGDRACATLGLSGKL